MEILQQYKELWTFGGRYIFLLSGAGTGKSHAVAQRIIHSCLDNKNKHWLCTRKYHSDVSRSVFSDIVSIIEDNNLSKYFSVSGTSRVIKCKKTNSRITCTGVDNPNKIKSISKVTDGFLEEADEMTETDIDIILSRIRHGKDVNQIIFAFNPPEYNHHIANRWFEQGKILPDYNVPYYWDETVVLSNGEQVKQEHLALRSHYQYNPFLKAETRAEYENLKNHSQALYESLCLGTWISNTHSSFFSKTFYQEASELGRNIIYIDSSYSPIEGQGDYVCVIKVSYVNSNYYVNDVQLKKNLGIQQIYETAEMMCDRNTISIHYDGWFYQPTVWKLFQGYNNTKKMIPEQLKVNKLLPKVINLWITNKIYFPLNFKATSIGQEALNQLWAFTTKTSKTKMHDDFPDALICAVYLLNEMYSVSKFYNKVVM